jgi:HlyD family secretion protein
MEPKVDSEPDLDDLPANQPARSLADSPSRAILASRGKYRSGIRWFVASGAIAVTGIGGWFAYHWFLQRAPTPVAVSLIPVKRGTVELTTSESGVVELDNQQVLKSPEDVTVEQVFVRAGDRVKVGAPLIVLRNREGQQRQQDQIIENQKYLVDLARKREIVREQQARLKNAEQRLKDSQELLSQGFISETEMQGDRDKVDIAQSEVRNAEIEQRKAELDVQKGQAALREIQQRLGDNRLNSPIAALILRVEVKPGDGAKRETALLTLGNPTRENVSLQLTTLNASKVRINQVARVSMIGPNPKMFLGRVVSLSPQASAQQSENSFGSQPQAKVDAAVALDRPSNTLIPGSQVSVEIVLNQRRNVVVLPLEAIQQLEEKPFVWIKNRVGRAEKRPVQLGLQSLTTIEVKAGLQPGERVVLPSPTQPLTAGAALKESASDAVPSPVP